MKKMKILALSSLFVAGTTMSEPPGEKEMAKLLIQQHNEVEQSSQNQREDEEQKVAFVKFDEEQIKKMGLKIETAAPGSITTKLSSRGKIVVDPDKLAHMTPKVPGIAKEAHKNIGNAVQAGEILAVLESQEMADLKASYLTATSKEKLTQGLYVREKSLFNKGISSGQDFLNAQNSWEEARINLQLAEQKLLAFGLNAPALARLKEQKSPDLRDYIITSPIDGTILMRHLTTGEFVDHNTTIYEIADLNTVWVETAIYPKDLAHVREGQQVDVVNPENLTTEKNALLP